MDIALLRSYLDHPEEAFAWLSSWGMQALERAHANLVRIATARFPLDLLADLCDQLAENLPGCPDPDMALNNLERYLSAALNPLSVASLLQRDRSALPILIQIFSTSQYFSDLLIADRGAFELLRLTEGQPVSREALVQEVATEVLAVSTPLAVTAALRRFKRRETLRIGFGDIVRAQPLELVTRQISYLADAIVEAAVRSARINLEQKYGTPRTLDDKPARFVVLALGKLGGEELNYSSDIDLVFLYEAEGQTSPRKLNNREFFDRLAREVVKLLSEVTELGHAYRVDLRLRPEGARGPLVCSVEAAWQYYDLVGRTWERQAFVKARPIAGDLPLGSEFLTRLEPWVYRRYLGLADITGIKMLKRRIEQRARLEGGDKHNVKTGHGGIRDVEFVIQFLQLLAGGDLPQVRTGNTLVALGQLEQVGCLTDQERGILESNYRFLRKIEHRLQFMFDLQTHLIPTAPGEQRRLAIRLGYADQPNRSALQAFQEDLQTATELNRKILDHLLHDAFPDDPDVEPEADLVLDPDPSAERIRDVLARYPFRDPQDAYRHLMTLATENMRFLYPRRCRLFLASIARRLLEAIAATPNPDQTLLQLAQVSDSLGGKVVLWELFRFSPPSLRLYVEMCSSSPLLTGIVISNPGMIDELMDSLVLNKLPTVAEMRGDVRELTRAAEDLDPILQSFKNSYLLRIGIRDVLGKEPVENVHSALTDLAETCLEPIVEAETQKLIARFGQPILEGGARSGEPCELILLAMGKFGGRELSYQSDLDLVFLYEGEGRTVQPKRSRRTETTTNQHFFGELAQRIIKATSQIGPQGRLYEIDARLRPSGRSGTLATSLTGLQQYFSSGTGQLWERQALLKARVLFASPDLSRRTSQLVQSIVFEHPWQAEDAEAIRTMRNRLEYATGGGINLKRGAGGIVDIEFLVQMLQLQHGREHLTLRVPGTLQALAALYELHLLDAEDYQRFADGYRFLRRVSARLKLMKPTAKDELPEDVSELEKLAQQLGFDSTESFLHECQTQTARTRERFEHLFGAAAR